MSVECQTASDRTDESSCWCCGRPSSEDDLVHLGNHPEVGICVSCVHFGHDDGSAGRLRVKRGWLLLAGGGGWEAR